MAIVKPFAALRPDPALAAQLCELPYDVFSSDEARRTAAGNPLSFLHVSRPEIDIPEEVHPADERVYARGRSNFQRFIADGALRQDHHPSFYLYRQSIGSHSQLGLVAVTSCQEYLEGAIKRHELTRPEKEDDRVRHIECLDAQTGPAFLTYAADVLLDGCLAEQSKLKPDVDYVARDEVRHTSWSITDPSVQRQIAERFSQIHPLYIADGHHRSAAAARVFRSRNGSGQSAFFLSVIFPHNQLRILPYHRTIKDLNGLAVPQLMEKLLEIFVLTGRGASQPAEKHTVCIYLDGRWQELAFRPEFLQATDPVEKLDVTLLQKHVLGPILGIEDPRTSARIGFVGGIRGAAELERIVRQGKAACAFSLHPTSIEDLIAIAGQGKLMPPKSTWFEPKLRDGMFAHLI
jgi:uncharacterized protein (DUF1015 family)